MMQDLTALKSNNRQTADLVRANARLTAFGAMDHDNGTFDFSQKEASQHQLVKESDKR